MLNTLEAMDYAPLQVTMSSTLDTDAYISNVAAGWWQGQYALGYATWHRSSAVRGAYSGMTSEEFASAYEARYDGMSVPYQGTAQFAAGCALAHAIETADSLDTEAVAAALRAQDPTISHYPHHLPLSPAPPNTISHHLPPPHRHDPPPPAARRRT